MSKFVAGFAAFALFAITSTAQVSLTNLGVDLPGHITAVATDLGAVLTAALAAMGAFLVVRKGWRFVKRIG